MSFTIWLADQTLSVSDKAVFFSSNQILGSTSDLELQTAAAVITSFMGKYLDAAAGIAEFQVSVGAEIGTNEGVHGVWVTPHLVLRNQQNAASSITLGIALLVTYADLPKPTTALWGGATELMSPPVAAGAQILGQLQQPVQWLTAGLSGFDLTFSDQADHWFYDLTAYVGVSPISGAQLALQGQATIADDSQHWGVAPVQGTAIAIASDDDGYPFLQYKQVNVSSLGVVSSTAQWTTTPFAPASYGVFLTGFALSMGAKSDTKITQISVAANASKPSFDGDVLTMGVAVTAEVFDNSTSNVLQLATVSYVALVMAPAPSTPRS